MRGQEVGEKISIGTCCTSAVVLLKSSMYREPMHSLCLLRALLASSSLGKRTKASPVARPSAWCTNSMPSSPSSTSTEFSPDRKNSSCKKLETTGVTPDQVPDAQPSTLWRGVSLSESLHHKHLFQTAPKVWKHQLHVCRENITTPPSTFLSNAWWHLYNTQKYTHE